MNPQLPFTNWQKIGEGAYSTVYKAEYNRVDFAVKECDLNKFPVQEWQEIKDAYQKEHEILLSLQHEGLPKTGRRFEFPQENKLYAVQEYIPGLTLQQLIDRSPGQALPERDAIQITAKMCDILSYCHTNTDQLGSPYPIIHRDIKPANIIVNNRRVVLLDLGNATDYIGKAGGLGNELQGTPPYNPPEFHWASTFTPCAQSDIYSVGIMLYQLLTGKKPRMSLERVAMNNNGMNISLTLPNTIKKKQELETIIEQATRINPFERFDGQDNPAGIMKKELERLLSKCKGTAKLKQLKKKIAKKKRGTAGEKIMDTFDTMFSYMALPILSVSAFPTTARLAQPFSHPDADPNDAHTIKNVRNWIREREESIFGDVSANNMVTLLLVTVGTTGYIAFGPTLTGLSIGGIAATNLLSEIYETVHAKKLKQEYHL